MVIMITMMTLIVTTPTSICNGTAVEMAVSVLMSII